MAFAGTTVPKLPSGFFDRSYNNDVCSHFEKDWGGYVIEIWIERDDPEKREVDMQYCIGIKKSEANIFEEFIEFVENDFSAEGLEKVSRKLWKEIYRLMKKYSR